jgi:AcrR family transcriptional regulator
MASTLLAPQPLQWIRPPRQARTLESLERFLDAATELLQEKRFEDVHVTEIARRAGGSVAAFYRRFEDKNALLHALHERLCEEAFATADDALAAERWRGAEIAEILGAVFPFLIEVFVRNHALDRAIHQLAMSDERLRERSSRLIRYVVDGLSERLLERRGEIRHPDPKLAVSFALLQSVALLVQHYTVAMREVEIVPLSDERVARELASSCLAYLGVRDPSIYATYAPEPLRGVPQ